jgi:two-component system chemotaxis response regulator CheB
MPNSRSGPIRAVVVDDSATMRELLYAILQADGDIQVVGEGTTGEDAIRLVKRLHPDIVTMDIQMPKMDGLQATLKIMQENPTPIIVISANTKYQEMDLTFQALKAGALTIVQKPGLGDPEGCQHIVQMVRLMADVPVVRLWARNDFTSSTSDHLPKPGTQSVLAAKQRFAASESIINIIGIAASTGGPSALATILKTLPPDFSLPVLVVQHISPGFLSGFADWLGKQTPLRVEVASHGDMLQPGIVLVAPDDYHMQVNERGVVELSKAPPYKGLRPSANYLFHSLANVFGPNALGIILTGMGDDGAAGILALHDSGGLTYAQEPNSCVINGMPQEAVNLKAIDRILTLEEIGVELERLVINQLAAAA